MLNWLKYWLLSFNAAKCKVLHIGNAPYTGHYSLDGTQLELLENIWNFGIQVDAKLKFHTHTDTVVKRAYRVFGLICKSFECKDCDIIVKLYTTLVRPIVEYNNVLWGPSYIHTWQSKIERIQRKATRMIPSISPLPYHNGLRQLNLPSLQHRRRRGDLIYLYQILEGTYDIHNQLFTPSNSITRGYTKKLFKYHTNSYARFNFYSNRVINDWNSLPQSIVDSPSVNEFKMLLDRHYSNYLFDFV